MKYKILLASALYTFSLTSIFAAEQPMPSLPEYFAEPPRPRPVSDAFSGLAGFYLTVKGGINIILGNHLDFSNIHFLDIHDFALDKTTNSVGQFGVAVGYAWDTIGFDRVELEYMNRGNIDFEGNDRFGTFYTSSLKNQTLLLKGFYDINFDTPVVPFLSLGLGAASNHLSTNPSHHVIGDLNTTNYYFAASVGLGVRWYVTPNFILGAEYDFEYLGRYKKTIHHNETLESNNILGNAFLLSLTVQF
jgi:opacity protein-like surface antigen